MADYDPGAIDAAVVQMKSAALAVAMEFAPDCQSRMRAQAPWADQNGPSLTGLNARQSLECEAGEEGSEIVIVARSTRAGVRPWRGFANAPIGAFLEMGTRRMSARAVVAPTMTAMQGQLSATLTALFAGDMP